MSKGLTSVNHSTIHQQVWTWLFCISCVCFSFPQFFQKYKIGMFVLHLASRDQDISYSSLHSIRNSLTGNFSRNSPSERQGSWGILTSLSPLLIGISVPQGRGEVADFSLHSHSTSFAQWFLRKVYADWEDGIRAGLVGGEGNPCSGNCSTQTQTPGARKRQPGKIFVHPDVNSVLLTSPSCLHSIRISSPRVCGGCGGHQDETGSTRSSQTWNQRLGEFLFCQLHWIYLEHHLF